MSLSVVGAVVNNLVQNVVYALITSTVLAMTYLPYLALIGVVSGLTVGFAVTLLLKNYRKRFLSFKTLIISLSQSTQLRRYTRKYTRRYARKAEKIDAFSTTRFLFLGNLFSIKSKRYPICGHNKMKKQ